MDDEAAWGSSISYRDARDAGIGRGALRGPRYLVPFHGVRVPTGARGLLDDRSRTALLQRCAWYAPRLRPGQFFSHATALALYGAVVPQRELDTLHVSVHRPASPPRTRGVHGHRLQMRESDIRLVSGLPVEAPHRAWVQASRSWSTDELVIAADHLVRRDRPVTTIVRLRSEALQMRGDVLGESLGLIRSGSESSRETELRLILVRGGLPEPELNLTLFDAAGGFVARLDQAFRLYRVGVEYDGRQHAFDVGQFRRDADRWDAIRDEGWLLVRILDHHVSPNPAVALAKVSAALRARGWTPPSR